jgi:hypothetical protein
MSYRGPTTRTERLIRREELSDEEAAPALLRPLGFEKVTLVFEQPPAT